MWEAPSSQNPLPEKIIERRKGGFIDLRLPGAILSKLSHPE